MVFLRLGSGRVVPNSGPLVASGIGGCLVFPLHHRFYPTFFGKVWHDCTQLCRLLSSAEAATGPDTM